MGTYTGKNTLVQVGDTPVTVGKVKSISLNGEVEVQEDEYLGVAGVDIAVGNEKWDSSITVHHDPEDPGQQALTLGATVDITLFPQGNSTGKTKIEYSAIVTSDPLTIEPNAKVEKALPLKVQGVPTKTTIV